MPRPRTTTRCLLAVLVAAGFLCRLMLALPGFWSGAAEAFARPDTPGYLGPARALAAGQGYLVEPGGAPSVIRSPGFPGVASVVFRAGGDEAALALTLILVGALTGIGVFAVGRELRGDRTGLVAAALWEFNLSAIANAPMLLTDTLYAAVVCAQLYCFVRFWKSREIGWFTGTLALAGAGTLVRPIGLAWIVPAMVLLAVTPRLSPRKKLIAALSGTAAFALFVVPWSWRNAALGAGFRVDVNSGAMYHQNGAMILAMAVGADYEQEKQRILRECDDAFADRSRFPDDASRVEYRLTRFRELIRRYPLAWLRGHFQWSVLLPDAPTLCENLGATTPGRGTLNVLRRDGAAAAVRHYFGPRWPWFAALLTPLLAVTVFLYAGAFLRILRYLTRWRRDWRMVLLVLAFVEYFFFLPGPITAPRYQLPALPLLAVLAALWWTGSRRSRALRRTNSETANIAANTAR